MTKKKTNYALWTVICLVGILAVGTVATIAFVGNANRVIENVEVYQEAPQPSTPVGDGNLGSVASPVINERYLCVGGICKYYLIQPMLTATSTLCSIPNPITTATSSLESFDFIINTGTSTAATIIMATSTSAYATTTEAAGNLITAKSVAANASGGWSWMPVGGQIRDNQIAPADNILLKTEGTALSGSGYTFVGYCQAVIRVNVPLY